MRYPDPIFSRRLGKRIQQVTKASARKAYEAGLTVYLLPSKCAIDNYWVSFCPLNKASQAWAGQTFEHDVCDYMHYNCCSELGYYPIYFLELE